MSQTQWFDGKLKPKVDGVYKRRFRHSLEFAHWARFKKGLWYRADHSYEVAKSEVELSPVQDSAQWAGCTETDWIPGKIKPVRDGVYKRQAWLGNTVYAKFKNGKWYMASDRYEDAENCNIPSNQQFVYPWWKGIHHEHQ